MRPPLLKEQMVKKWTNRKRTKYYLPLVDSRSPCNCLKEETFEFGSEWSAALAGISAEPFCSDFIKSSRRVSASPSKSRSS